MKKIILHHHLGLGDHFICNGLVREVKKSWHLDLLILPVKEHNMATVSSLYDGQNGIELMVVPRHFYDEEDAYIISRSKSLEVPILKISYDGSITSAFDISFYSQVDLNPEISWSNFSAPVATESARALYTRIIGHEKYCLVSNAGSVGSFAIKVDTRLPIYTISPGYTDNLLDWAEIISKAEEIHCIDSSVIHLVDRIPTRAQRLVYHNVGRGSIFNLKKSWERMNSMEMREKRGALIRVFDAHFSALPDEHIFEFERLGRHILNPRKFTPKALRRPMGFFVRKSLKKGYGRWRHVCHYSFKRLLTELASLEEAPKILETGSSAHGTNSSKLFFEVVDLLDGEFDTVDLNTEATQRVQSLLEQRYAHIMGKAHCHNGDSVEYIRNAQGSYNVVYLDSYDLYPGIFKESEEHGLAEFIEVSGKLADTAYILIDDTPRTRVIFDRMNDAKFMSAVDEHLRLHGHLPGKGALVLKMIANDARFTILYHEYQLLLKFRRASS